MELLESLALTNLAPSQSQITRDIADIYLICRNFNCNIVDNNSDPVQSCE